MQSSGAWEAAAMMCWKAWVLELISLSQRFGTWRTSGKILTLVSLVFPCVHGDNITSYVLELQKYEKYSIWKDLILVLGSIIPQKILIFLSWLPKWWYKELKRSDNNWWKSIKKIKSLEIVLKTYRRWKNIYVQVRLLNQDKNSEIPCHWTLSPFCSSARWKLSSGQVEQRTVGSLSSQIWVKGCGFYLVKGSYQYISAPSYEVK